MGLFRRNTEAEPTVAMRLPEGRPQQASESSNEARIERFREANLAWVALIESGLAAQSRVALEAADHADEMFKK